MQAQLAPLAFFSPLFLSSIAIFRPICKNMFLPKSEGRVTCGKYVSKQEITKLTGQSHVWFCQTASSSFSCLGLCVIFLDYKAVWARSWSFGFFVYA